MTPMESEAEFRKRLGNPAEQLKPRQGLDSMLAFYAGQRAECAPPEEDGDMLLFQWGTYDFAAPPTFQLDITRQFIVPDEDEPYQLHLTFHFASTSALQALNSGNKWCSDPNHLTAFRRFIEASAPYRAVADVEPLRVELDFEQC